MICVIFRQIVTCFLTLFKNFPVSHKVFLVVSRCVIGHVTIFRGSYFRNFVKLIFWVTAANSFLTKVLLWEIVWPSSLKFDRRNFEISEREKFKLCYRFSVKRRNFGKLADLGRTWLYFFDEIFLKVAWIQNCYFCKDINRIGTKVRPKSDMVFFLTNPTYKCGFTSYRPVRPPWTVSYLNMDHCS